MASLAETEALDEPKVSDIAATAAARRKQALQRTSDWRTQAKEDYAFAAGDQWTAQEASELKEQLRPVVAFNRVGVVIDAVVGHEVGSREAVRYIPRQPNQNDSTLSELQTAGAKWVRDSCDAEDEESHAFHDLVTCGMGWTETSVSYDDDLDGRILIERADPLEMTWDPQATKRNLVDSRWFDRARLYTKAELKAEWPEKWAQVEGQLEAAGMDPEQGIHDAGRDDEAYSDDDGLSQATGMEYLKGRFRVSQHQWREPEAVYRIATPNGVQEVSAEAFRKLKAKLDTKGVRYVKQTRQVWKRAFICGKVVLQGPEPVPGGKGPSLQPMTGKYDRNTGCWYGLVRPMKDPQRYANKFFSQTMHIVNTNAKGGLMVERSAVENVEKLKADWAKVDNIAVFQDGALTSDRVKPKPPPQIPPALDAMMQYSLSSIREVSGVSLELMGVVDREQAGTVELQRKQQGLAVLSVFFDSLRRYRKNQGRILQGFMAEFISDGRMMRIAGEDGNMQYIPLSREATAAEYDIIVDTAPDSPNEKERVFAILTQLLPTLMKAGIPIPPELLDFAPLPSALSAKWKELIAKGPQVPPELQQQMEEMGQKLKATEEENNRLRIGEQSKMAQAQLDHQIEQQRMAMEAEKAKAEMMLEQAKAEAQIEIERAKAEAQIQVQMAKLQTDAIVAGHKAEMADAEHRAEMTRKDAEVDPAKRTQIDLDGVNKALRQLTRVMGAKKKPVRDADNRIVGMEVELPPEEEDDGDIGAAIQRALQAASAPIRIERGPAGVMGVGRMN